jgi:hypothetical protein
MIWWHRCSTNGKREGEAAGGRVAATHVDWLLCVLCELCVLCVVCCVLWLCFVFCNIRVVLEAAQHKTLRSMNGASLNLRK